MQPHYLRYTTYMANLTLVYGMRLLPSDEIKSVGDAPVQLKNGHTARVTMHVLEGSKEEIEAQLRNSVEAFFDIYPEISTTRSRSFTSRSLGCPGTLDPLIYPIPHYLV